MDRLRLTLYHFIVTLIYVYGLYIYEVDVIPNLAHHRSYGGKWKYLTYWNMCVQFLYFSLCFLCDLIGTKSGQSLQKVRDVIFASLAFPLSVFVSMLFWVLYYIDRELVYPVYLDQVIPCWLNHVMHTTVLLFTVIEMYVDFHKYPPKTVGYSLLIGFSSAYIAWVFWIAYVANIWVYGVLAVLGLSYRIAFVVANWAIILLTYAIGQSLNCYLWGQHSTMKKKSM